MTVTMPSHLCSIHSLLEATSKSDSGKLRVDVLVRNQHTEQLLRDA